MHFSLDPGKDDGRMRTLIQLEVLFDSPHKFIHGHRLVESHNSPGAAFSFLVRIADIFYRLLNRPAIDSHGKPIIDTTLNRVKSSVRRIHGDSGGSAAKQGGLDRV